MAIVRLDKATENHCLELAPTLRKEDCEEVWSSNHLKPLEALILSVRASIVSYTVLVDDKPLLVFGVAPLNDQKGVSPWLLSSSDLQKYGVRLYRESKKHTEAMLKQYGYMENYVHAENKLSIRWLKWLGFEIHPAQPYGMEGELFHKFTMGG